MRGTRCLRSGRRAVVIVMVRVCGRTSVNEAAQERVDVERRIRALGVGLARVLEGVGRRQTDGGPDEHQDTQKADGPGPPQSERGGQAKAKE
jgi:hypothetical protein